jgi:cold-inducible RNA-binding protein
MKSIFVGNLSFQTTESDVRGAFETYGEITRVQLMTDRETGRARGFGFVEMSDDQEAASAITGMHGKELDGRALTVNEARPRAERGSSNSGGRENSSRDDYRGAARQPRESRW